MKRGCCLLLALTLLLACMGCSAAGDPGETSAGASTATVSEDSSDLAAASSEAAAGALFAGFQESDLKGLAATVREESGEDTGSTEEAVRRCFFGGKRDGNRRVGDGIFAYRSPDCHRSRPSEPRKQ